jgi:multiple sugar transport system substrate-binding protein
MKRLTSILALLILASSLYAGGGKDKVTTLRFMETMTSTGRTELFKQLIAEYEASHPGIKIELISPPYDQAESRASMTLSVKEALDIIEVRDINVTQYITNKWIDDISSRVTTLPEWDTVLATGKELAKGVDGKTYMVPEFFFVPALFVRTDVLSRLGVTTYPGTFDELYALCKRITNPGNNQFGWTMRGRGNPFRQADFIVISSVSNVNPDNLYQLKNGTSIYDSPEYLTAFTAYVDLFKGAVPSDGVNWGFNEQVTSFASGITPFLMQDSDAVPAIQEHLRDDQFTTIPMPVGSTGTFVYNPGFACLGIPSHSKNKDAAWDFITFLSSAAKNAEICKVYGSLPVHSTTYDADPFFSSGHYKAFATTLSSPQKYATVNYPYASEKYPGWAQVYQQYLQSTFLGQTTPQQAVKAFSDYWK